MHLGRFHAVIGDLRNHFSSSEIIAKLERCSSVILQYAKAPSDEILELFRTSLESVIQASELKNPDLLKPYAQQIILELGLAEFFGSSFANSINKVVADGHFHHARIAKGIQKLKNSLEKKVVSIVSMDDAFTVLDVEYERVTNDEAEVGILIPRPIVGETLPALSTEFDHFAKLFRAINELTAAKDYDPKVRTISSSWWQFFLEVDSLQIGAWIVAVERIAALFKTNLEIKALQQQLKNHDLPEQVTEAIDNAIAARLRTAIGTLASDIRHDFARIDDQARLNEIETQLRHGLLHLAKRVGEGGEVEINVAIPVVPRSVPAAEQLANDPKLLEKIEEQRARIAELRLLRERASAASAATIESTDAERLLLRYFDQNDH